MTVHEMGIAEAILAAVLEVARGEQVRRVAVRVGARQAIDADRLVVAFRLAAEGTPAATAMVEITEVPLRVRCVQCGEVAETSGALWSCWGCAGRDLEVLTGDELVVDAVELDHGRLARPTVNAG